MCFFFLWLVEVSGLGMAFLIFLKTFGWGMGVLILDSLKIN